MTSRSEPAAVLASLNPVGIGTPMAESLDSYAHRLATAHRVPRYCIDALVLSDANSISRPKRATSLMRLNSPSESAKQYAQRLAHLTGRPEARFLGIGHLAGVVGRLQACYMNHRWCSECFWEMEQNNQEIYWPQLWSIPAVQFCHLHRVRLVDFCPNCLQVLPIEKSWTGPVQCCSKCGVNLAIAPNPRASEWRSSEDCLIEDGFEMHATQELGDLVAALPDIVQSETPLNVDLDALLDHCREFGLANTQRELCRRSALLPSTLHVIARKKHVPTIGNLVSLAVCCGISLAGLICSKFWKVKPGIEKMAARYFEFPDRRKAHIYENWSEVEYRVAQEMCKGNADLPYPMAKRIGVSEKQFCLRLPLLANELRAAVKKKLLHPAEYERLRARLIEVVESIEEKRGRISKAAIAVELQTTLRNRAFNRAWAEICSPSFLWTYKRSLPSQQIVSQDGDFQPDNI